MKVKITTQAGHYKGNHYAIVLGIKDVDTRPYILAQFVRTAFLKNALKELKNKYPGQTVRAILQPHPAIFGPDL